MLVTERELEAVVLILTESKALDKAPSSFVQAISMELPEVSPIAGKGQEVGSCQLPDEDGGPCLFLCYRFSGTTEQLSMTII